MKLRVTHRWRSLFVISLILSLFLGQVSVIKAQALEPSQLVQQGVEEYHDRQYQQAIDSWHKALTTYQETGDRASTVIVLENLARAYQKIGQTEKAIAFWQEVGNTYTQLGDIQQLARSLTEQAQVYSRLGQHRQAIALLCGSKDKWSSPDEQDSSNPETEHKCQAGSAIALAQQQKDRLGEVAALGSLGETYRLRGNYKQALGYLQNSLKLAQEISNPHLEISALNSLGNTYSSLAQVNYRRGLSAERRGEIYGENSLLTRYTKEGKKQDYRALDYFQQSLRLATAQQNPLYQIKAIISSLPIYYRLEQYSTAETLLKQALNLLPFLPPQPETIYAQIDLAKLLQPQKITPDRCFNPTTLPQARKLLQQAVSLARDIEDRRGESFALGELAHTYECSQDYQQALELNQQARLAAEKDKDSLYLWEWQTGRILIKQGNKEVGIAAYKRAIATLESIRGDILTANRDIQFDFRDTVEPIYRQLIEQKLEKVINSSVIEPDRTNNVTSILNTVDSLKLAELQNYFGNDCNLRDVTVTTVDVTNSDRQTVYFSSIILDNRTAIIALFPGGKTKVIWHQKNRQAIEQEINEFRRNLERFRNNYNPQLGKNIYQWFISPFAQDLDQAEIKTLVFIQDGLLRSIPMAALYDGEKFLIEKYAIATTPSLNLTHPAALNRNRLRALVLGLTEASQIDGRQFAPLPNVQTEISQVQDILIESKGFIDEEFTRDRLQQELAETSYPIIHIATHGQFGSEPEDTFLVTGNEEKLTLTELDRIIRSTIPSNNPVELISLTACQTAVGDDRAALGLAGVAVQAGVNSALASLWSIGDETTPRIIQQFYSSLKDSNSNKAEALRQAQIASIQRGIHPAYWASFIIIGNWL